MVSGFGDMNSLLKQAQEMQRRMQDAQRTIGAQTFTGSAGGGAVRVEMTGNLDLKSIHIERAAVDPQDVEGLEDLVTVAFRQALTAAREFREREMNKVTGGMNLPGFGF